ncbi:hypothetical protein SAMN06297251_107149 [Fulvimarina manganoxydans]|uniref:Endonuclease YncB, thermonuclease family n=1 Tax=Fulvimarina manganoxydans TaxID=937218 RepID=A0A1W2BUC1_9HYPH|nr:thermonuclease family protein [Fulvimarina manganoxydans]SMC76481.1 hypothetical protein SAMN06297251_107149 [Fulvimarina manganoxydans]
MRTEGYLAIALGFSILSFGLLVLAPVDTRPMRDLFDRPSVRIVEGGGHFDPLTGEVRPRAAVPPNDAAPAEPVDEASQAEVDSASSSQGPLRRLPPRGALSDLAAPAEKPEDDVAKRLLARPVALDAARIAIGQAVVELPGVEPLELAAQCSSGSLTWPCGARSRTELRNFLRGRSIECEVPNRFGESRESITSACSVGDEDIGAWVVSRGWAQAVPGGPYEDLQASAKANGLGIWR